MVKLKSQKIRILLIIFIPILIIAGIVATIIIKINTPPCSGLIGSWRYDGIEYSGDYTFTFIDDTHGRYDMAGDTQNFTYQDYSTYFSLLFAGNDIPASYTYQLSSDNKTLTIQDSFGDNVVYICQ